MSTHFRNYISEPGFTEDFYKVRDFLVRINRKNPIQYDFEWGRWEWAFSLPFLDTSNLSKIGIWEDNNTIVALVTYEEGLGQAYFCIDKQYSHLQEEMLLYAKGNLYDDEGNLKVLINNSDREFQKIAAQYGFSPTQDTEPNAVYDIEVDSIEYTIPPGYLVKSLAEACDLIKLHRVLWRGFNHEGEPPTTAEHLNHAHRREQSTALLSARVAGSSRTRT